MAEVISSYGEIDPQHYYTPESAARAMGMSKRWVLDNLINSDEIKVRRKGDFIGIPGWMMAQWIESDLRTRTEWLKGEDQPEEPPPKSGSKRSS